MLTFLNVCAALCVYFQSLLGTSLCKPVYLCLACCGGINHIMCVQRKERDKSPDTFMIRSFIPIMPLVWRTDGITDCYAASLSIMVCPVCLVGLLFDWIMTRWAVTRDTDEQRNISHSAAHQQLSLCALCLPMNCNLFYWENVGSPKFQRSTPMVADLRSHLRVGRDVGSFSVFGVM